MEGARRRTGGCPDRLRSRETSVESENDDDREARKKEAVGVYIGAVDFLIKPAAVV